MLIFYTQYIRFIDLHCFISKHCLSSGRSAAAMMPYERLM